MTYDKASQEPTTPEKEPSMKDDQWKGEDLIRVGYVRPVPSLVEARAERLKERRKLVAALAKKGMTSTDIAADLKVPQPTVRSDLIALGML